MAPRSSTVFSRQRAAPCRWLPLAVLTAILLQGPVGAIASGAESAINSVYKHGDLILQNPVESCVIFIFVIAVSSGLEFALGVAEHVKSRYFRVVYESLAQEVMIVGMIALLLLFGTSFAHMPLRWIIITTWANIVLFYMAVYFVIIITVSIVRLHFQTRSWGELESGRVDVDPRLSRREMMFKQAREKLCASMKVVGLLGANVTPQDNRVLFSDYLTRRVQRNITAVANLGWKTWVGLGVMIIINGVRAISIPQGQKAANGQVEFTTGQRVINIMSYIGVVGYLTMFLFLGVNLLLQMRLSRYLSGPLLMSGASEEDPKAEAQVGDNMDDEDDTKALQQEIPLAERMVRPSGLLIWGSVGTTFDVIQFIIILIEWYAAVLTLGVLVDLWKHIPAGYAFLITLVALVPIVVFMWMLPWTLAVVSMMSGLGSDLDVRTCEKLMKHGDGEGVEDSDSEGGHSEEEGGLDSSKIIFLDGQDEAATAGGGPDPNALDEWEGEEVTLFDPKKAPPARNPARLVGVAPQKAGKSYKERKLRPVFDSAHLL